MDSFNSSSLPVGPSEHPARPAVVHAPYYSYGGGYAPETPDETGDGSLIDYWRMLNRHRAPILLTALICGMIGFAVSLPMKPVYRTHTSIEVLNVNEDFMNSKQTNPVTTNDYSSDTSEEQTQTKLLQSDSLINRVILKLDRSAAAPPAPQKMATSGWRALLHLPEPAPVPERLRELSAISGSLKVSPTPRTRIIEATVTSTNPKLAAEFANTLVQEFIQQNLEARYASSHRTSDWLAREIDDARANLKRAEDELQAYARTSGLIFTDENTNVATEKLQQVQSQLSAATADRIAKQARYELARNSPPDTLADVLSDSGLKEITSKTNEVRRQIAELSAVYNPEYNKIKRAQAELAVLEAAFEHSRADIVKRIDNDYQEASSREKLLAAAYDAQTREVTGQDEKAIQYNILKREVDSSRQLYDTMLQQTKQSSIASALRASNVRVIDEAEVPSAPFSPNFKMNAALGLFAGLFLSVGLVTVRERADRMLYQPGDIKLWTNLSELGTIPSADAALHKIYGGYEPPKAEKPISVNGGRPLGLNCHEFKQSVELITWQQKPSFVAEGFRSTLTSILFVGENGSRPRVLVFTSANASDGKTTVVSNLAIAIAEIRRKVLIIDADLRRPRMHQIFNAPNDRGLSNLLSEELTEANAEGLIHETTIPNLHVLPAGPPTHAAAHLLYSRNFAPFLARLKKEYDMVLIDTPPMMQMTDARVAGRLSDAVILVVRSGETSRDAILAAKDRLNEDSIRVLGTVLNDWDPKKAPGGYYGQYKYNYYAKYQGASN